MRQAESAAVLVSRDVGRNRLVAVAPVLLMFGILLAVAANFLLAARQNINWDEFNYLTLVHTYLRGELATRLQTFHVHLFTWLPGLAPNMSGYKKIWRGDFGFPSNHVEEGSIGLQTLTDVGVVSPIYTVFRFDPEKVDRDYAFAVLKTGLYRHIFEVSTSASVDRRGSLRWSEFSKLPFPLPSLAEQKAIAEVLRTAKSDLDALTTEIDAVTHQKRGLMQKLLTGEWRVAC